MANGNGLHVPRWALVAGGLLISIITATVSVTLVAAQKIGQDEITRLRLCRLEGGVALLLDRSGIVHDLRPWRTCGEPR